jgi:hypothetical protein
LGAPIVVAGATRRIHPTRRGRRVGEEVRPQAPDPELVGILRQADPHRLQQTVSSLVGFGTRHLARAARVCAAVTWSLSRGPAAPKNVFMNVSPVSNDTDLSWDAGTEPDLAGYEVVWRETSDEDWSHFIRVGNVTKAHLPLLSKDNVFFGYGPSTRPNTTAR